MKAGKSKFWLVFLLSAQRSGGQVPRPPEIQQAAERAWNMVLPACEGVRHVVDASGEILAIEQLTWDVKGKKASDADVDMGLYWTGTTIASGVVARRLEPGSGWLPCATNSSCGVRAKFELVLWKRSSGWSTFATSESPLRRLKAMDCGRAEEVTALLSPPRPLPSSPSPLPLVPAPGAWEPPVPGALARQTGSARYAVPGPLPAPLRPRRPAVWLQVIAVREESSRIVAGRLKREGFPVVTEPVPDKPLVRVIVGPVSSGAQERLTTLGFTPFPTGART